VRLLLVTPFLPDVQATHGGGLYLGTLCRALARRAELGLTALLRADEQERLQQGDHPFAWQASAPLPERPRGMALAAHRARMLAHWGLQGQPLVAAKHRSPALLAALARAQAEFRPDAVLIELAQMAQYLQHVHSVPTVFTDHECGTPANAQTDLGRWADRRDARLWRQFVLRHYPRASLLQAVTAEDAAGLSRLLGLPVATRPPIVDVPATPVAPQATPPRALFLGDYSHFPNPQAAGVLARDVLPRLRAAIPDAELWLAGPNPQRLNGVGHAPGVRVVGYAKDLPALFGQVRLLLAPLYSGGGFRMKSISALAHGLPVVTNALGARGCDAPAPARTVADDLGALVDAAVRLLREPALAGTAGRAAHAWAREHLSPDAVAAAQIARLEPLLRR
jgi:hypothetical protein